MYACVQLCVTKRERVGIISYFKKDRERRPGFTVNNCWWKNISMYRPYSLKDLLDFSFHDFIREAGGVGDDKVPLVPGGVVAQVFLQQGVHVLQFLVPQVKLL